MSQLQRKRKKHKRKKQVIRKLINILSSSYMNPNMELDTSYTIFVIGIVTTGFNGLYINNKHHQIIDISCRLYDSPDIRYDRLCYPSDDFVIHPMSIQIHGHRSVDELKHKRAIKTRTAVEGVYSFIEKNTRENTTPMIVAHQANYVYTALDLVLRVPEHILWVCSKRAIKTLYPEMEEFRWELVSINKKLQEVEDRRITDMKVGQVVKPMHLDTDFTPYRLKNMMRYFYRDVQSHAYKSISTAKGMTDNICSLIRDVIFKKTEHLEWYKMEREYQNEHRFAIRLKDIYGLKRSFIEDLSNHINECYLRSPGFEKEHCVNPSTIAIGDLVVFSSFLVLNSPSSEKMAYTKGPQEPKQPVSEWYAIAMELERLIRMEFKIHNEELILTLMSYVLGISLSDTIRLVYPTLAGTSQAFYPLTIKDEVAFLLYKEFDIKTIMDLENEYLLCSNDPEKSRSMMNKIRVKLFAIEDHATIESIFNSTTFENLFRRLST